MSEQELDNQSRDLNSSDQVAESEVEAADAEVQADDAGSADADVSAAEDTTAVPETEDADASEAGTDAAGSDAAESDAASAEEAADDVDPEEEFKAKLRRQEGDWYVIHSYAGYENRVKTNLENRIQSLNMEEEIFEIQVPMEEVVEVKNAQRKIVNRVRIPGYVLVRMYLTDES
ncbi:MAG TPA: transcription termination/antitermination NusG family protein, partial [Arthrobacter sp.]|nr:transcription termination/antitermination NusG family protein [Arthrobacter sp.]